jgi:hypothetical protein
MNIERGIRRLMIVVSGLILALGMWAVVAGERIGVVVAVVGVVIGLLWATFFTLRWVARGFLREPESAGTHPQINWNPVRAWAVGGLALALLALIGWHWHAIVDGFLAYPGVIWLRQTVGDRGAAMLGIGLAALAALGLVSEWWDEHSRRRQSRAQQRLNEHYAACQACQQLPDDDEYCPVGQRLYREWMEP